MITSLSNEKVKFARGLSAKKNRSTHRQFLVEGVRAIEEAERAGTVPALVFYDPAAVETDDRAQRLINKLQARTSRIDAVSPAVLSSLAQTETPQGIIGVYSFPDFPLPAAPSLALVIDAVRDPGNLGTMLRTAWAAGVDAALLGPGTADPYNPKVVRAAMGAHFSLPIRPLPWPEIARSIRASGGVQSAFA
ncbi:MAG: TrmH family RNA methyltransferase [Rudaea sp.]